MEAIVVLSKPIGIFKDFRIRVAKVERDYSLADRV